jgi:hypothetical protein
MQSRLNDNVVFRCPTELRSALERIAGNPRALSELVRRALVEFVERSASAEREASR